MKKGIWEISISIIFVSILLSFSPGILPAFSQPSIDFLGDLPGGNFLSFARSVSSDGSVVVGTSISATTTEPYRWTESGGMVGLGLLPGATTGSGNAVSGDGNTVVGVMSAPGTPGFEAFIWTPSGGLVGLGDVAGVATPRSNAQGISADGTTIVGLGKSATTALKWTPAGVITELGHLPGGGSSSTAVDVTSDGSVIVGLSDSSIGIQPFRWTSSGGMVGLGLLPGTSFGTARSISEEGTIVGTAFIGGITGEAFTWKDGVLTGLGHLPGGTSSSFGNAISSDGSIVAGAAHNDNGQVAHIWDQTNGMRDLNDVATGLGIDLLGHRLQNVLDISPDGRFIVGDSIRSDGKFEAYRLDLAPPGPPSNPGGGSGNSDPPADPGPPSETPGQGDPPENPGPPPGRGR